MGRFVCDSSENFLQLIKIILSATNDLTYQLESLVKFKSFIALVRISSTSFRLEVITNPLKTARSHII